jgi:hypothetical protein
VSHHFTHSVVPVVLRCHVAWCLIFWVPRYYFFLKKIKKKKKNIKNIEYPIWLGWFGHPTGQTLTFSGEPLPSLSSHCSSQSLSPSLFPSLYSHRPSQSLNPSLFPSLYHTKHDLVVPASKSPGTRRLRARQYTQGVQRGDLNIGNIC